MTTRFSAEIMHLIDRAERELEAIFKNIERISRLRTEQVMDAMAARRVSETDFIPSSGYGYGDAGRDKLDLLYADVFGTEAALVRPHIVSGTHALTIGLFGLLRPGDTLLSVTGKPYDTLNEVIGISGAEGNGSLKDFGVRYRQLDLTPDSQVQTDKLLQILNSDSGVKVVYLQRSRGYEQRYALSCEQINRIYDLVKKHSNAFFVVDNCYGEFVEESEPKADLLIGSLIKNPGGGFAESGGYLAGTQEAVDLAAARLTSPGIGAECGASLGQNKNMYRGLFYAPHTVSQALKTAVLAAYVFDALGFEVSPKFNDFRSDIIETVTFHSPEKLCEFCRGIQSASPVDAFVTPEPWDMPGYDNLVIMAAGAFVQGASIELSADGPLRPPYTAFFQGGLTYESGRLAIAAAADRIIKHQ